MYELHLKTSKQTELIDITVLVEQLLKKDKIKSGICTVFIPHTTAAVTINENADPSVCRDILAEMNKVIPFDDDYRHGEGNSAAHIKSSLFGSSETVIVEDGHLQLGTWQGIYFAEFDGPRTRKIWVKII